MTKIHIQPHDKKEDSIQLAVMFWVIVAGIALFTANALAFAYFV